MIKEVSGDILLSKAEAIAHSVAPFDHFDSGLALNLREQWPSMFKDFKHYCHQYHPKTGTAWLWGSASGLRIISLLTQDASTNKGHGGHPGVASLPNVAHALQELKKIIVKEHLRSIALPRLATGVGGLDWEEVKPLIYSNLGDANVHVFIYSTFVKGQQAMETAL